MSGGGPLRDSQILRQAQDDTFHDYSVAKFHPGGVLTTLGLLHPIGPILKLGPMMTATRQMHWKTPVWATEGGAELLLTNIAITVALATQHPGNLSLDHPLGIAVPKAVTLAVLAGVAAGLITSEVQSPSGDDDEEQTSAEAD